MTDVRAMTQAEGEDVVAYLRAVPDEAWDTMTVCAPWTVADIVAHLTAMGNQTMGNFARGFVASGFSFDKFVNRDMQKYLTGTAEERVDRLEQSVDNPSTPDRLKKIALGEMMCHGEDIRRALGDRGDHPAEHVSEVGPMYVETKAPLNGRMRAENLSFRATDGGWTHGSGPEVRGPGMDLLCAITGRPYALDQLKGDGVAALRSRL
ncbi:MAG: maleylpyruvate isomerase family mycothiol-dependent enzyme [Acidimicrobiales bacterium]